MRASYRNADADAWIESILREPSAFRFVYGGASIQGFHENEFSCAYKTGSGKRTRKPRNTAFERMITCIAALRP